MDDSRKTKSEEPTLHVLDLPQLYQRPQASELLCTLEQLKAKPASWRSHSRASLPDVDGERTQIDEDGIPNYLTGIISSSLGWIGDADTREEIWEAASARLAERSGRAAQPTLSRTFSIPNHASHEGHIHICLREPSLIADNLGHKTWLASYLLACRLPSLKPLLFPLSGVSTTKSYESWTCAPENVAGHIRVLELGSGTGLLGIAAAALFPDLQVRLTDLEAIVPNLQDNVDANRALFRKDNVPLVNELDWSCTPVPGILTERYHIILASDPLYSSSHSTWLFNTIHAHLRQCDTSRVVVELPLREAYVPEVDEFRKRMRDGGFVLLESGEETGTEDWGDDTRHESREVRCWWGVWGWS